MCIFVPYAKSWGKKAESSVQYEAWDTVLEGAHEKEPRKYEMEDTKKHDGHSCSDPRAFLRYFVCDPLQSELGASSGRAPAVSEIYPHSDQHFRDGVSGADGSGGSSDKSDADRHRRISAV